MSLKMQIYYYSFLAFLKAWVIKTRKKMDAIHIPLHKYKKRLCSKELIYIIEVSDLLVDFGAKRTSRKCFFRSYIMASVLRRMGIPIQINVGLKNLNGFYRSNGHCWLSLNGFPFAEKNDPIDKYPFKITDSDNGISYWVGS